MLLLFPSVGSHDLRSVSEPTFIYDFFVWSHIWLFVPSWHALQTPPQLNNSIFFWQLTGVARCYGLGYNFQVEWATDPEALIPKDAYVPFVRSASRIQLRLRLDTYAKSGNSARWLSSPNWSLEKPGMFFQFRHITPLSSTKHVPQKTDICSGKPWHKSI